MSGEESTVTLHSKLQFGLLFLEFSAVETRASTSVFGKWVNCVYFLLFVCMCLRKRRKPLLPSSTKCPLGLEVSAYVRAKSLQSCLTLCNPMDCSPSGSSVPGFSRQEHWSGLPSSRGFSRPGDRTHVSYVSCIDRWVLYQEVNAVGAKCPTRRCRSRRQWH